VCKGRDLNLRRANPEDVDLLFNWVNDPITRAMSRSSASIPWETHKIWFEAKLQDDNAVIWIGMVEDQPVGQVRVDHTGAGAEVDVSVDAEHRGRGIGTALLKALVALSPFGGTLLYAEVKRENLGSIGAFLSAGFIENGGDAGYRRFSWQER